MGSALPAASGTAILAGPSGLHARLAARVARAACAYRSHCVIGYGGRLADAASVYALLELSVPAGSQVTVRAEGADAAQAVAHLTRLLGEEKESPNALTGVGLAPGIGTGRVLLVEALRADTHGEGCGAPLDRAREEALRALAQEAAWAEATLGADVATLLRAHAEVLADPAFLRRLEPLLGEGLSRDEALGRMAGTGPEGQVLADLGVRLGRVLRAPTPAEEDAGPVVLVGRQVLPADLLALSGRVHGVAVAEGGWLSHAALLARAMGIPMVSGVSEGELTAFVAGELVEVDGDHGRVRRLGRTEALSRQNESTEAHLGVEATYGRPEFGGNQPSSPLLYANANDPREVAQALAAGAQGIGLVRSEYLQWARPASLDEAGWYEAFGGILEAAAGRPVVIRLADLGGAKSAPAGEPSQGPRGARYLLEHPLLLRAQVRALLRLLGRFAVRALVPLVESPSAWRALAAVWDEEVLRLGLVAPTGGSQGMLGLAVETPAMVEHLAQVVSEAAFVSVGANDLSHALLGQARETSLLPVEALGLRPALLGAIRQVVETAHAVGVPVHLCGDLAGWLPDALVLWGLGVDVLSVAPRRLPALATALQGLSRAEAQTLAQAALAATTTDSVAAALTAWLRGHPEIIRLPAR
ncbi:MAG: HPr family phosphocarrier protein [Anaerolineae bacterium]